MESQYLHMPDGAQLHVFTSQAVGPCCGQVLLVHGLSEHGGRYGHLVELFNRAGFNVLIPDLRGHGKTLGPRGHVADYTLFLDDLDFLIDQLASEHPRLPIVLYGHSMGGGIVAHWLVKRHHPAVCAGVLSAPWLHLTNTPTSLQVLLYRIAAAVFPNFTVPAQPPIEHLTSDREASRRYQEDPLIHRRISLRLAVQAYDAGLASIAAAESCTIPLLIVHSPDDHITSASGSELFAQRAPHAELTLLPGFAHEYHNEPGWRTVAEPIVDWVREHCREAVIDEARHRTETPSVEKLYG